MRRTVLSAIAVLAIGAVAATATTPALAAEVDRISGNDRYSTAAKLSMAAYESGADTVYIASGESYADALSAGPAAGSEDGPLLLTTAGILPKATTDELTRLSPAHIVVAGGPSAVSNTVLQQLQSYASDGAIRIAGNDRFETSRLLAQRQIDQDTDISAVILATGLNYPDALAAGAAQVPVVLVDGGASALDAATAKLLDDADLTVIGIAGGTQAVSSGIETSAQPYAEVQRFSGSNRYETAVALDTAVAGSGGDNPFALVVSGENFPDALAVSAVSGGAPIVLTTPSCMPAASRLYLRIGSQNDEKPEYSWIVIGGEAAVSEESANGQPC